MGALKVRLRLVSLIVAIAEESRDPVQELIEPYQ